LKFAAHISILLCVAASCQRTQTKSNWSFSENIGLAVLKAGKACLSIQNRSLAANSVIRLVNSAPPQTASDARVIAIDESCSDTPDGDLRHYEIRAENAGLVPSSPAIAIAGFSGSFNTEGDSVAADLDADGQPEYFRFCTSSEGLHFTVWSGKPLEGRLRWHQYYYLGYDVEPTCTPNELNPPK